MQTSNPRRLALLVGSWLLFFSGLAAAEPPSRAARLGYTSGTVSFSPAGETDWLQAAVNRPLTTGDRLWTDERSRAEVQIGGAAIRLGADTDLTLLNLDDRITQLMVYQGTVKLRVRSLAPDQSIEVATPNLAFTLDRAGDYRIEVDANDDATSVIVASGTGEVYGEGASYTVRPGRSYRFYGRWLADYEVLPAQRADDLDRWSAQRDRRIERSPSARYVSAEVVGYEDLDANGSWRVDRDHGNVWTPNRVAVGWTPYRDGHWTWIDPWGWTWVDDAPWGYAVSHYGRWARIGNAWGWVPGPRRERAVYAPALVAFVGGGPFQLTVTAGSNNAGAVGWFPLAPREVYRPGYAVSRGYFDRINRSNAVIAPTVITNVYNTTIVNNTTNIVVNQRFANQQVLGAVVAVPTQAFVQSRPVARATLNLSREQVISAPVAPIATVAPVVQSLHGGARDAAAPPPRRNQAVVVRTAPPVAVLPFAAQQKQLAASPGRPIDDQQRNQLKPTAPSSTAPKVSVVPAVEAPKPVAAPPATAPAARTPEARRADADRPLRAPPAGLRRPEATPRVEVKGEAPGSEAAGNAATQATAKAEAARTEAGKLRDGKIEANRVDRARNAAEGAGAQPEKADAKPVEAERAERAKALAERAEAARARQALPPRPAASASRNVVEPKAAEPRASDADKPAADAPRRRQ